MEASDGQVFERNYALHLQHVKLKGLQPKTIEVCSRAIRRIGERFGGHIDALAEIAQSFFSRGLPLIAPG